ncbi:MAG: hypothetical protein NUV59_02885 [Patescibacteria group bacterium]|nr:hypothetical protein [Patescibacteria group bacterium]
MKLHEAIQQALALLDADKEDDIVRLDTLVKLYTYHNGEVSPRDWPEVLDGFYGQLCRVSEGPEKKHKLQMESMLRTAHNNLWDKLNASQTAARRCAADEYRSHRNRVGRNLNVRV